MVTETLSRRHFLQLTAAFFAATLLTSCGKNAKKVNTVSTPGAQYTETELISVEQFAEHIVSLENAEQRAEAIRSYNLSMYPLIADHAQLPATGTHFLQSPVMAFSVRDCPVPSSIDEMQTLGTSASQMKLLSLMPPSIVLVENFEVAKISMQAFGIPPSRHVLVLATNVGLDGAQWAEDWASEYVTYSQTGELVARTSNYAANVGYGRLLSTLAGLVPGVMQVKPYAIDLFEGGNMEAVVSNGRFDIYYTQGDKRINEREQLQAEFPDARLIELQPVGQVQHTDEMVTFHHMRNGSIVALIAEPPEDASEELLAKYRHNQKIIEGQPNLVNAYLPTGLLPIVNVAVYGDMVVYPDPGGLTAEQRINIKSTLETAFNGSTVKPVELDPIGQGGANCLTGSVPIEFLAILKAQLEKNSLEYFSVSL